jgi:hypothetical protein
MDPKDKHFIKAFTRDMTTTGFQLLWHKEKVSINPSRVTLCLKPGYDTPGGSYCGPRLFWADRSIKLDKTTSGNLNLFDIHSLERAKPIHLGDYPFAIPGRSIFLKLTRGREFVFEANSEQDAAWFVHGMRWVIARFSFNLVIGNVDVSCELLDLGLKERPAKAPRTLFEEALWARAMDDVTDQLVDSVFYG